LDSWPELPSYSPLEQNLTAMNPTNIGRALSFPDDLRHVWRDNHFTKDPSMNSFLRTAALSIVVAGSMVAAMDFDKRMAAYHAGD
jgi:hypothetical protein